MIKINTGDVNKKKLVFFLKVAYNTCMPCERISRTPSLTVTLPARAEFVQTERLPELGNLKVTTLRIHLAKTDPRLAFEYLNAGVKDEFDCLIDTEGAKPRTVWTPGMVQGKDSQEGNWFFPVEKGTLFMMIPRGSNYFQKREEFKVALKLTPDTIVVKANYLPESLAGSLADSQPKRLAFSDGELVAEILETIKEGEKVVAVKLEVVRKKEGVELFWKLGWIGDNLSVFTGKEPPFSSKDLRGLRFLAERGKETGIWPQKVAVSFANPENVNKAIEELRKMAYPETTVLVAKIETQAGIENLETIAKILGGRGEIVLARADLGLDCQATGESLDETVKQALIRLKNIGYHQVALASLVFDSARDQIWNQAENLLLTAKEMARLDSDAEKVGMLWLTNETANGGSRWMESAEEVYRFLVWKYYAERVLGIPNN